MTIAFGEATETVALSNRIMDGFVCLLSNVKKDMEILYLTKAIQVLEVVRDFIMKSPPVNVISLQDVAQKFLITDEIPMVFHCDNMETMVLAKICGSGMFGTGMKTFLSFGELLAATKQGGQELLPAKIAEFQVAMAEVGLAIGVKPMTAFVPSDVELLGFSELKASNRAFNMKFQLIECTDEEEKEKEKKQVLDDVMAELINCRKQATSTPSARGVSHLRKGHWNDSPAQLCAAAFDLLLFPWGCVGIPRI